jgi:hypothetical protein
MASSLNSNDIANNAVKNNEINLGTTSTATSTTVLLVSEVNTNSHHLTAQHNQQQQTIDVPSEVITAEKVVSGNLKKSVCRFYS